MVIESCVFEGVGGWRKKQKATPLPGSGWQKRKFVGVGGWTISKSHYHYPPTRRFHVVLLKEGNSHNKPALDRLLARLLARRTWPLRANMAVASEHGRGQLQRGHDGLVAARVLGTPVPVIPAIIDLPRKKGMPTSSRIWFANEL